MAEDRTYRNGKVTVIYKGLLEPCLILNDSTEIEFRIEGPIYYIKRYAKGKRISVRLWFTLDGTLEYIGPGPSGVSIYWNERGRVREIWPYMNDITHGIRVML
jgi:hypothetical protein